MTCLAPSWSQREIAPVGHASAAGRASCQALKSNSGLPRNCSERTGGAFGYGTVAMPVANVVWRILNMAQRSVPEYERLKLLLITGKSAMMLPCTASTRAGQLFSEASLILQRSRQLPCPVRTQCMISPRHPSTALSAHLFAGIGCGVAQYDPSGRSLAAARTR